MLAVLVNTRPYCCFLKAFPHQALNLSSKITYLEFEKLTFSKKLTFYFANRRELSCLGTRNKISIASGLIRLNYYALLHKGYLNLGSIEVDIISCRLVLKKGIFLFIMYLSFPCDFLSMIFGFLGKFRIDIEKIQKKNIFFQGRNFSRKKVKMQIFMIFRDFFRFHNKVWEISI